MALKIRKRVLAYAHLEQYCILGRDDSPTTEEEANSPPTRAKDDGNFRFKKTSP